MIYVLGGSTKMFAVIGVTYPSGSTCTCTNGTKTLTAKGTSGTAIFNVPSTGTWTVTATNGDKTTSKSVSITAEGQTEKVTLVFCLYLYNSGDECTSVTGGWNYTKLQGNSYWEKVPFVNSGEVLTANTSSSLSTYCMTGPTNKIDVTDYSKLVFVVTELSRNSTSGQGSLGKAGIGTQASYTTSQAISDIFNSTFSASVDCSVGTLKLDISNITGEQYIQIGCISYNISVSSVYLEV
jgi:hypothetical protein